MSDSGSTGGQENIPWYPATPGDGGGGPGSRQTEPAYGVFGGGAPVSEKKRRLPVLIGGVLAAAVIAAVLAVVLPGGGKNAQAAVIASVNHAVASKTARANLTMSIDSGKLAGSGAGTIDFANGSMDFNLSVHLQSVDESLPIHLIFLAGTMYEGFPQIAQAFPGKSWLSLDLSGVTNGAGGGGTLNLGGNPAAMLRLLSQQGNNVVSIGTTDVGGVTVTGYRVTFDQAAIQRQLSSGDIPSWMRGAISQVSLRNATETVYIDTSGQLRRTAVHAEVNGPSGQSTAVDETFDLFDYGVPVSVSAPPAGQVVDIQQFLQGLGSSSST